jgi:Spy/CpxP family protein refolding chaperone
MAVVLAAGVAGVAAAQQRGFGGMMGGMFGGAQSGFQLVSNTGVQEELKVTAEQKDQLKEKAAGFGEKQREMFGKLRELAQEEGGREKIQAMMREMNEEAGKAIAAVLKEDQMKRFKQIEMQQAGIQVFAAPDAQKALKLTDEQKEKIKAFGEDLAKDQQEMMAEMRKNFQPGGGFDPDSIRKTMEDMGKKQTNLRKEYMDKARKALNEEQAKTLDEMLGKPFDVKFEMPAFGKKDQ